jgi:hypothetical protein
MDDPTIPANDRFIQYIYNGGSLTFNYDFPVYTPSSVAVYVDDRRLSFPSEYTVTIGEQFDGGTVTLFAAQDTRVAESGATVTIVGDTPLVRTEYYSDKPVVSPPALDAECNKTVMRVQQINTKILGCLRNVIEETEVANTTLPPTDLRRGKMAAWDGDSGALSYIGDGAMAQIYLKRSDNLADLTDVDSARQHLQIIDGREFTNTGTPVPYRNTLEFDRAFKLVNDLTRSILSLNIVVTNTGMGLPIITQYSGNTLWGRCIRAGDNVAVRLSSDGAIEISAKFSTDEYCYSFSASTWDGDGRIVIEPSEHGLGSDDRLLCLVRDRGGNDVEVDINVSGGGIVTMATNDPFPGTVMVLSVFQKFMQREYTHTFLAASWDGDGRIVIPPAEHGLGSDDRLLCLVRDRGGNDVEVDINVSGGGIVTMVTSDPFPGYVIIFGGPDHSHMFNPMTDTGDIIYSTNEFGTPARLQIGTPGQALCVGDEGTPRYTTMGECAWMTANIPGGPVLLNSDSMIPAECLPISTMSYKGTFGSSSSSTGGDLPSSGVLDGDIFIADADYTSSVAAMFFSTGEWAIYNGAEWSKIPSMHPSTSPVGSIIPYAGMTVPNEYLPCDGYQLSKTDYAQLYAAIGDIYDTGAEPNGYFSIPDYNTSGYFLQGSTTPGTVKQPGLPNITGAIGYDGNASDILSGAFFDGGQHKGAEGGSWNNRYALFDAARSNAIYGASDTVQPPARTVMFLIKYL